MEFDIQQILTIVLIGGLAIILVYGWVQSKSQDAAKENAYYELQARTFYDMDANEEIINLRSKFSTEERIAFERRRRDEIEEINNACKIYGIRYRLNYIPYFKEINLNEIDDEDITINKND